MAVSIDLADEAEANGGNLYLLDLSMIVNDAEARQLAAWLTRLGWLGDAADIDAMLEQLGGSTQ